MDTILLLVPGARWRAEISQRRVRMIILHHITQHYITSHHTIAVTLLTSTFLTGLHNTGVEYTLELRGQGTSEAGSLRLVPPAAQPLL